MLFVLFGWYKVFIFWDGDDEGKGKRGGEEDVLRCVFVESGEGHGRKGKGWELTKSAIRSLFRPFGAT